MSCISESHQPRRRRWRGVVVSLCVWFAWILVWGGPPVDLVLVNGKVFTGEATEPWAEALAIRGTLVVANGTSASMQALAGARTQVIDLDGRVVIPGLNDAHTHVSWTRVQEARINDIAFVPGPGPTAAEIYALVAQKVQDVPPGTTITGYFGNAFIDDPDANRFALDQVSPDHPVHLHAWAGHGTLINTAAMVDAGISPTEPDPVAGFYERVSGTQTINGWLHEYAEHQYFRHLKERIPVAEMQQQYLDYAQGAVQFGVTSIQDMALGLTKARSEVILKDLDLPLRWRDICFPLTPAESCESSLNRSTMHRRDSRFTSSGIKWISDGSPVERFAFLRKPYTDLPGAFGVYNFAGLLQDILNKSRYGQRADRQLLVHAVGDRALDELLDGLDANSPGLAWRHRRARIEHGDLITPDQYPRIARWDLVVVQNPIHFAVADTLAERFGPQRMTTIQPMQSLLAEGIVVALGSDVVFGVPNPFVDLFFAVTHPANPQEALTMEQAVRAYTWGSAYAEFKDHQKGTLTPGKLADLAVLSQDIFTLPPPAILSTTSLLTLVGGEVVHDAGVLIP